MSRCAKILRPDIVVLFVLVCIQYLCVSGAVADEEIKYMNAPKYLPGTTVEMHNPEFWINNIKGNPDKVYLTPQKIAELNRENIAKSYVRKDVRGKEYSIKSARTNMVEDPLTVNTFSGDSLRVLLDVNKKSLESNTYYDFRHKEYDEDMKNELYVKTNTESIPATITPRYGIIVVHSNNRKFPTEKFGYRERGGWINSFSDTSLDLAMPVAILHESIDRDWYFVRSQLNFGWVPARNIAVGLKQEISDYVEAPDFIVSTCYKVPVYGDPDMRGFLVDLYMGAKVKLVDKTGDGYRVLMPFRNPDGSFRTVSGWVKPDARVSVGYQSFTQRNILNTFFTVLYRPWSGGDMYNERHCCGGIRAVLRTFGIITLNSTTFELHASDHVIAFPEDTPREEKYSYIKGKEPGICLVGSRQHVIMYLGEYDGRHFFIHQSGYPYTAEDGTIMLPRRVNVNDAELEGGSHVDTWTYICELKP
ncbi:MAG: SH3 domain-containing protein [Candidatus Latescibacteria bacterium]|nr:SH3 domain-containing protein [Candidatus Latescibacterota bacterium]